MMAETSVAVEVEVEVEIDDAELCADTKAVETELDTGSLDIETDADVDIDGNDVEVEVTVEIERAGHRDDGAESQADRSADARAGRSEVTPPRPPRGSPVPRRGGESVPMAGETPDAGVETDPGDGHGERPDVPGETAPTRASLSSADGDRTSPFIVDDREE